MPTEEENKASDDTNDAYMNLTVAFFSPLSV